MSSIFVKVVDKTVSDKQLSVELTKIQPVKIEGKSAEQIVKNLETLLDRKDSLKITAGGRIFSNEMVLMEEIFDAFETQNINDMAYYYQIQTHQSKKISKFFAAAAKAQKSKNSDHLNLANSREVFFLLLIFIRKSCIILKRSFE